MQADFEVRVREQLDRRPRRWCHRCSASYPDEVRVVEMGGPFLAGTGGAHVSNTAQIGPVTILGESSIGSGVRAGWRPTWGWIRFDHLAKGVR